MAKPAKQGLLLLILPYCFDVDKVLVGFKISGHKCANCD